MLKENMEECVFKLGIIGYGDAGEDFVEAAVYVNGWEAAAVGGRNMKKAGVLGKKLNVPARTAASTAVSRTFRRVSSSISPPPEVFEKAL